MFSRSPSGFVVPSGSVAVASVPGSKQQRRAARAVAVGDRRALGDLQLVVEVDAGDAVVVGDQHDSSTRS